jgi:T5SS/PEP-CTERM-associated repeat protein
MNTGSLWNSVGLLRIGDGGSGEVNITLGGKVTGVNTEIGSFTSGEVNVDGPGSLWDSSGTLTIGALGSGTLSITNQGVVENEDGFIGNSNTPSSIGTVTVNGAGSLWRNTNVVVVGFGGTGTLNIAGGGTVESRAGDVGLLSGSTGNVTVDGIGSVWDTGGGLLVGNSGEGTVTITGGGVVQGSNWLCRRQWIERHRGRQRFPLGQFR